MPILAYILTALAAYLIGSIPTGFLVGRAKGIDIRAAGSGNIGATNAMRVLGKPAGIFVLLVDALKGWLACYLGLICAHFSLMAWHHPIADSDAVFYDKLFNEFPFSIVAGIFAVLGHNYTCWLKFKGGKGIATTAGVYLALAPFPLLIALAVFILALLLTRYVSAASISAAVALPAAVWILPPHNLLLGIVTTALGAMAIYKHKSNIQRLMTGTENRLGKNKQTLLPSTGVLFLIVGLAMAGYFILVFDTSVASGSGRVVNLGLMADRQNGIIVGIGLGIIGAIIFAIGSRNQK